ncbi:asparaginyl tRNA synthetase [Trichuris trichiura]|uniref:asparagine--tRNA ligase n=1 Tax=Trichuris trichiura TaxID=36087 RepID=A0A077Z8G3_TRITR|nr:asparaginyl tRNA synthetase [Trichuris trichiura]
MRLSVVKLKGVQSVYHLLRHGIVGEEVKVQGWVRHFRKHKSVSFLQLSDGLSARSLQVVVPKEAPSHFNVGAAVEVRGILQQSAGKEQEVDLAASEINLIGDFERLNYPFATRKKQLPSTLRQHPHLRPKTSSFAAFLRIRSRMKYALHRYFQDKGFVLIECPVITTNDCEAAGETFLVDTLDPPYIESGEDVAQVDKTCSDNFFGRPVYLTVSGQLHLEAAACGLKQVYSFGPTFRAESSLTRQHLAEFQMLEVELAFCNELKTLLQLVEDIVVFSARELLTSSSDDFEMCQQYHGTSSKSLLSTISEMESFPKITFAEAVEILQKHTALPFSTMKHIGKASERYLVQHFGNKPVFVVDYPSDVKPFYMKRSRQNNTACCFDLLVPHVGELCGGSLRETDYTTIAERVSSMGMAHQLQWYADLRKYGYANLGGFGLGFERLLQFLLAIENIKDCVAFPRWFRHCLT